jgi:2-dehydropantoate 2-reductase
MRFAPVKFTIIGAGAIGGITGAHLARSGHDVTFVDRADDHLAAIRERGLTLEGRSNFTARVAAAVRPEHLRAPLGTVLCAMKTLHTTDALVPVIPLLGPDEFVVSMQNGLAPYDVIAAVGTDRTLAACFNFGGHYEGPGRVIHGTDGGFHVGELDGTMTSRVRELAIALSCVQPCEPTDNILGCLWSKMAMASVFFATALVDADVPDILARPEYQELFADLAAETVAAAVANHVELVELHGFDPRTLRPAVRTRAAGERALMSIAGAFNPLQQRTGIWIDLAVRKRRTEADPQIGRIVTEGRNAGLRMPLNAAVHQLINELESGKRSFAWENLDEVARRGRAQ